MYSSNSGDNYQKMSSPAAPPSQGIPVSSGNSYYPHNQAPPQGHHVGAQSAAPWATGLCDCLSDCETCCLTWWCPCITFGRIAEIVDKGATSCGTSGALYTLIALVTGCQCFYSCFYRTKMRQQYMLHEGPCGDCLLHCCCEACALCQEYRELKHRGFDMAIGWHGNMERQNRGVAMAPVVEGGMTR